MRGSKQAQLAPFQRQQLFFDRQTAAVSGEFAIAADHAMTRDHDGDWIGAVGKTYGSRSFRISDSPRQFAVGNCLAVRNVAKAPPDFELEWRALGRELQIEVFQLSSEISFELADGFAVRSAVFYPGRLRLGRVSSFHKHDFTETAV